MYWYKWTHTHTQNGKEFRWTSSTCRLVFDCFFFMNWGPYIKSLEINLRVDGCLFWENLTQSPLLRTIWVSAVSGHHFHANFFHQIGLMFYHDWQLQVSMWLRHLWRFLLDKCFCLPGAAGKPLLCKLGQHRALVVFTEACFSSHAPQSHTGTWHAIRAGWPLIWFNSYYNSKGSCYIIGI